MKKLIYVAVALLAMISVLLFSGCEPMLDTYESDTFELGDSGKPWYSSLE